MSYEKFLKRPLLRGHLHQNAFFAYLGACVLLVLKSTQQLTLIASLVYSIGLLFLLGTSAFYHRKYWQEKHRAYMKKIDHSAIFIFIASSFTPICLLALPPDQGHSLLIIIWSVAFVGILQAFFWTNAPKFVKAIFYISMGWLAAPYISELHSSLGLTNLWLIISGGIVYTLGAVFYASKKPNIFPTIFGYHELFHLLIVIAAGLHFAVIYQLVT